MGSTSLFCFLWLFLSATFGLITEEVCLNKVWFYVHKAIKNFKKCKDEKNTVFEEKSICKEEGFIIQFLQKNILKIFDWIKKTVLLETNMGAHLA